MTLKLRQQRKGKKPGKKLALVPTPPLSTNHRAVLTFCGRYSGTEAAAGAGLYNFFRMNGAYDPDQATGGNALPGLSSIAALYRSMRVMNVTIEVDATLYNTSTANIMMTIIPTAFQAVLPANPDFWPVQRLAVCAPMPCVGITHNGVNFGLAFAGRVRASFKPHEIANLTRGQYVDEADYSSLTAGLPTKQLYMAVAFSTNGTAISYMASHVRISYDLEFFDPYPLS